MDITEVLADLAAKRAYLAERLRDEPLPTPPILVKHSRLRGSAPAGHY